ncbi:LysE/ArgO family amino acid transporter [Homoserinibacter sp. YIM 151385]|uniref:LysE/ArgO family amino acid transporter n=1 Tax=Homoserinibacter sp. YIM 151385 TaxID=2985506 RepID=UPI0022F02B41|nr:LysE family transporter [Homoserinibacter sp. YIM 151385]WBU36951.1 LysE family transporter [Homoserinibacter sp. YIM 151385]
MNALPALAAGLAGLALGLGIIVAIGAQNAFVLRQGVRREHILAVVLVCIVSDALLITAGVAGSGALFRAVPWLETVARYGGAAFLLVYGILAARRALRRPAADARGLVAAAPAEAPTGGTDAEVPGGVEPAGAEGARISESVVATETPTVTMSSRGLPAVVGTALALTWLNPHVYLDTLVLLGSVGSSHGELRWAFAAGAVLGSVLWFSALGLAARALAPVFAKPLAWRILDGGIALLMLGLAVALALGG